jgi:hypothetical protein
VLPLQERRPADVARDPGSDAGICPTPIRGFTCDT